MTAFPITYDFQAFVICAVVLYVKFLVSCMIQGRKGYAAGTRPPEDRRLPMAMGTATARPLPPPFYVIPSPKLDYHDDVGEATRLRAVEEEIRWRRIIQNDLESIPMALMVFLIGHLAGASCERLRLVLVVVYTVARVGHTFAFANHFAVGRMITWLTGILMILIGATSAVLAVIF